MPVAILESQVLSEQNIIRLDPADSDSVWGRNDPVYANQYFDDHKPGDRLEWDDPICRAVRALLSGGMPEASFSVVVPWDEDVFERQCQGRDFYFWRPQKTITFTPVPEGGYLVTGYEVERDSGLPHLTGYEAAANPHLPVTYYFDGAVLFAFTQKYGDYVPENRVFVGDKNETLPHFTWSRDDYQYAAFASTAGFVDCVLSAAPSLTSEQKDAIRQFYQTADTAWKVFLVKNPCKWVSNLERGLAVFD